jgi:hypothetical protein
MKSCSNHRRSSTISLSRQENGGFCMIGGIYTEERCPICGQAMKDNGRNAVACPDHPKQRASTMFVRFTRQIKKKFTNYEEASRFLNGLRFKVDENSYDARDYQRSNPLGFRTLAEKWLEYKQEEVSYGTFQSLRPLVRRAIVYFEDQNVKPKFLKNVYPIAHNSLQSQERFFGSIDICSHVLF